MGLSTLSEVPTTIRCGDTLLFAISTKYPSTEGWGLLFSGRSGTAAVEFSSTSTGPDAKHLVSVDAATTATWVPGPYHFQCRATLADATAITARLDEIDIVADLAQQEEAYDPRSFHKYCLDQVMDAMKRRAAGLIVNSTVAGISLGRLSEADLQARYNFHLSNYEMEQRALSAANKKNTAVIGISFVDAV